jgi:hypothetical protein
MAQDSKERGGLGIVDGLIIGVIAIVGIIIAFALLSFVAGLLWEVVKIGLIVAVVVGVLWLLVGRRR